MFGILSKYLSFIKFSHTIFALPFAFIGFFLAAKQTDLEWRVFWLVLLSMIFARSAAMAFNRYLDRRIDAKNPRTKKREIPSGKIKPQEALVFVILMSLAFIVCTWFINTLVFYLSFVALAVILGYSYTKRFTSLSHLILGAGLALAPIGAYLAVIAEFDLIPILFSFVVLFWVSGFDIIYSLQDYEFDKQNNLKSVPVILGKRRALIFSALLHFFSSFLLVIIGIWGNFGFLYYLGVFIFVVLLFYQHKLVRPDDLSKVDFAFFNLNGYASIILAIFTIADLFV